MNYKQLTEETTELLVMINGILDQIHSYIGFRIRGGVCFHMIYNELFTLLQLMQVAQDRSYLLRNITVWKSERLEGCSTLRDNGYSH